MGKEGEWFEGLVGRDGWLVEVGHVNCEPVVFFIIICIVGETGMRVLLDGDVSFVVAGLGP